MTSNSGSKSTSPSQGTQYTAASPESCTELLTARRNNIIWYTAASSHKKVAELNAECIAISRGPDRSEYADFQNATRTDPIELRFRGEGKLEKLRMLKKKWDAKGVFTRQFLD